MKKVSLKDLIREVQDPWQPKDIAYINHTALRIAKKGTRHRSRAKKAAWIMLVEPIKTKTKGEES
jgi:hypothetical protein